MSEMTCGPAKMEYDLCAIKDLPLVARGNHNELSKSQWRDVTTHMCKHRCDNRRNGKSGVTAVEWGSFGVLYNSTDGYPIYLKVAERQEVYCRDHDDKKHGMKKTYDELRN